MTNERERSKSQLSSLLTLLLFNETPIKSFQKNLRAALSNVLQACRIEVSVPSMCYDVVRFDDQALFECLSVIDLVGACQNYDQVLEKQSKVTSVVDTTLLECLLSAFADPCIYPLACHATLVRVLLGKIMFYPVSQTRQHQLEWPASQQYLLNFVTRLIRGQPDIDVHLLRSVMKATLVSDCKETKTFSVAVSVVKHWMRELPSLRLQLLVVLLDILCLFDKLERRLRKTLSQNSNEGINTATNRRTRPRHCPSLAFLHGELSHREEQTERVALLRRNKPGKKSWQPCSNRQLASNRLSREHATSELIALGRLRTKCLKVLRSSCQDLCMGSSAAVQTFFRDILDVSCRRQTCQHAPYVRLCAFLLADLTACKRSYKTLLHVVWSLAGADANHSFFLSFYVEVLIESSYFDDCQHFLYGASPLLCHLVAECAGAQRSAAGPKIQTYLQSLAFLIAYRGKMLVRHDEFSSLLIQLSNLYDDPNNWLDDNLSPRERMKLLQALDMTGVFGILGGPPAFAAHSDRPPENHDSQCDQSRWFFDPSAGATVRSCESYISTFMENGESPLLSQLSPTNASPPFERKRQLRHGLATQPNSKTVPSIMEYCNDDIVSHIFTFLGYKRILRMRLICKSWKTLADHDQGTWMSLYHSRFGWDPQDDDDDDDDAEESELPWKQLFVDRWRAEREIRFQRDKNGWKVRLCGRIGCLTRLSTPGHWQRHQAKHNAASRGKRRCPETLTRSRNKKKK